jgi:hypothetical protein
MTCERDVNLFERERKIETKIDAFSRRFHTLLLSISLLDEKDLIISHLIHLNLNQYTLHTHQVSFFFVIA